METMSVEQYKNIGKKEPRKNNQEEKRLQMAFGQMLLGYERMGCFSPNLIKWSYIANGEPRPAKNYVDKSGKKKRWSKVGIELLKKGVRKGVTDYYFGLNKNGICYDLWLEAKSKDGKLTAEQIIFRDNLFEVSNAKFIEFRTVEEGLDILKKEKILLIN